MATVAIRKRSRKKGTVYELVINDVVNGKRTRKYQALPVGTPKALAMKILTETQVALNLGQYVEKTSITFREYSQTYLDLYCSDLSPSTYHSYVGILTSAKTGIYDTFGSTPLQKITTESVQKYINYISNTMHKSPKSCRNTFNLMSLIMQRAVVSKYIQSNPCTNVALPRRRKAEAHAYSLEQIKLMLDRSKDDIALQTIIGLGALAGMRRGEICALTTDCIILSDNINELRIRENIVKYDCIVYRKDTKTQNSIRNIPIPLVLVDILKRALHNYKLRKLKYGDEFKDKDGQLICLDDGSFRDPQSIYKLYTKFIKEQDDLPHYTLHTLRHSYASIMIDLGVNPKILQENLGHSCVQTTLNIYTHSFNRSKQLEVLKLDEALRTAK
jgi:integrase